MKKTHSLASTLLFWGSVMVFLAVQGIFFLNMVQWLSAPDRGWVCFSEMGPHTVAWTRPLGEDSGLRRGDKIITINGKDFKTIDEMKATLDDLIGAPNIYEVDRGGQRLQVVVRTGELGFGNVAGQSGIYWMIGSLFIAIGILVFLMKPYHVPSWGFFYMTSTVGVFLTYSAASANFTYHWMGYIHVICNTFLAAPFIHLAAFFPERRNWLANRPWVLVLPYLFSLGLTLAIMFMSQDMLNAPPLLMGITYVYLISALLFFLGSALYGYFRPSSIAVRLQSMVIFTGVAISLFLPAVELLLNVLFHLSFLAGKIYFYLLFLIFFPLSIGYAIVRHDLFEIDTIVRRTYGYILSSGMVIMIYGGLVSLLNASAWSAEFSKSPVFSIGFTLGIVFIFRPAHERIQRFVDRMFYRQKYDYRQTIKAISEKMIRILDPMQIHDSLIGSIVGEMFLENGMLLLQAAGGGNFGVSVVKATDGEPFRTKTLAHEASLREVLSARPDGLFKHQVELDPAFEDRKVELKSSFEEFDADFMMPLLYQDELKGIISLGRKKSGKMFTPEDVDLLRTITNQSAVALENARLFQENIEKSRMEEELRIAHDLQVSMLPGEPPKMEGVQVAALSISAREVGGDFYDFITMPGTGGEKLGIVVADVSGKAVSGALVMAAARSIFRVLCETEQSIADMMRIGNARLQKDVKKGMFVALLFAAVEPDARRIRFSSAGQTEPILCRGAGGPPELLDSLGDKFPLGIIDDCDYQETVADFVPGDMLVLYTDGVVEAMNGRDEMYGFDRLISVIDSNRQAGSAEEFLLSVQKDVNAFVGGREQHDDLTMVVVRAT